MWEPACIYERHIAIEYVPFGEVLVQAPGESSAQGEKVSDQKDNFDPVRFKALAAIKWKDRHFHVICDAVNSETGVLLMIDPRAFPPEATYPDYPGQLEVRQPPDSLRKVEGREYRYLSVSLVDLDLLASGS